MNIFTKTSISKLLVTCCVPQALFSCQKRHSWIFEVMALVPKHVIWSKLALLTNEFINQGYGLFKNSHSAARVSKLLFFLALARVSSYSLIPQPGLPEGVLTFDKEFVVVHRPSGSPATWEPVAPITGTP